MKTPNSPAARKKIASRFVLLGTLTLLLGALALPLTSRHHSTSARPGIAGVTSRTNESRDVPPPHEPRARLPLGEDTASAAAEETPPDPLKAGAAMGDAGEEPGTAAAGQVIGRAWAQTAVADERIPDGVRFGGSRSFMLFPEPDASAAGPNPDDQIPDEGVETEPRRADEHGFVDGLNAGGLS